MFRRFPYWGWLAISIALWCAAGYRYYTHRQVQLPERMAHAVSDNLERQENVLHEFLTDTALQKRLFNNAATLKDIEHIQSYPFYIFGYVNGKLSFWNNSHISLYPDDTVAAKLLRNDNGIFTSRSIISSDKKEIKRITVLFPVVAIYPLENDYLKSHFIAEDNIPASTEVTAMPKNSSSLSIRDADNKIQFFLTFHQQDIQKWQPDNALIWLMVLALLTAITWVQLIAIYLSRIKSRSWLGLLVTVLAIAILRTLTYKYGLPLNLESFTLFSPRIYASSAWLSSLGNLIINVSCFLWLVVFIARHLRGDWFAFVKPQWLRLGLGAGLIVLLATYTFGFVSIIRSLVIDSSISFDVSHFYSINIYTLIGLITVSVLTGTSVLVIYLLHKHINILTGNKWVKYPLILIAGYIGVKLSGKFDYRFSYTLVAWLVVFIALLDIKRLKPVANFFEPHMVFWAIFVCAFCTGTLQYFNRIKEHESRKAYIDQHVTGQRDTPTEYTFSAKAKAIEQDKAVKSFLLNPNAVGRRTLNERLDAQYLGGPLNKYETKVYLFDKKGNPLFNKDTTDYNTLADEVNAATQTASDYLYYKEYINTGQNYISYIPVTEDTSNVIVGYAYINLSLKKAANETVYPELLQPPSVKVNANESDYAYGVYVNNKLIVQSGNYPFSVFLKSDTLRTGQYYFFDKGSYSELWYKNNDKRLIIVAYHHVFWLESIILFSYLFGIEVILSILILLYQLYLSYTSNIRYHGRFVTLTLRRRMHFSMLALVLVSFIIIGIVTVAFFTNEYKSSANDRLESAMQAVEQSAEQYLKQDNALYNKTTFDTVSRSAAFKYFITGLAATQKVDINIYDALGNLCVASQDEIYDKGLLSRIIRPDAYYQLAYAGKSLLIQDETIGGLTYLSCYVPLRNEYGNTMGYINVPFFSSEKDLNYQISNIIVTLINLYVIIFLLSSFITIFITRWLTRTLNIIIRQFSRLNLQRNERISWPYDDEIGLLVTEYNKMVEKVEENAILLAQSERETAWREMARQVAHEIKNPLTPMKLNIQYLQNALRNNYEHVHELADRVSVSLIEQIDNLSYIASEFSNFAKMPDARPEEIVLNNLLSSAAELYKNTPGLTIHLEQPQQPITVFSDRSQLLRIFTNLLENAKQAIPADRQGNIYIQLKEEDKQAIISVADNGTGISEEAAKRIFQPYFTTKSSGTGLGLAMTKKIVEFWNGKIWFETKEQEGTTFFIELPVIK